MFRVKEIQKWIEITYYIFSTVFDVTSFQILKKLYCVTYLLYPLKLNQSSGVTPAV